eukprot:1160083-Pelagomonas_calceolata.AAC.2
MQVLGRLSPLNSSDIARSFQFCRPCSSCPEAADLPSLDLACCVCIVPVQVIDLALERITERLRAELKLELQVSLGRCSCMTRKCEVAREALNDRKGKGSKAVPTYEGSFAGALALKLGGGLQAGAFDGSKPLDFPIFHHHQNFSEPHLAQGMKQGAGYQNERQPNHASQAAAVAAAQQLDGFLAQELEAQNTCPICYELMVPPDKAPVLLFPCGVCLHACVDKNDVCLSCVAVSLWCLQIKRLCCCSHAVHARQCVGDDVCRSCVLLARGASGGGKEPVLLGGACVHVHQE